MPAKKVRVIPATEPIRIGCDTDARNQDETHPNPAYVDAERWGELHKSNKIVQAMVDKGDITVTSHSAGVRKIENRTTGVLVLG